ncbi:SOS response-associated peptidase [Eubacterium sp. 1001713B170207_170306_E7]|uniref:SOS response-associated peptidase n=1 Tax=Eubacterium sp. 1001713B170207_170306_E7 TaxID=2787097 RepID=UPI001898E1DC|nr:SOS response-associated peptidase [Eubacterium sp. 1001713B170207_170306_E7]
MCGRYTLFSRKNDPEAQRLRQLLLKGGTPVPEGDIAPSEYAPVYIAGTKNGRVPAIMKWGYPNPYRKSLIINARSETLLEKETFREDFLNRRCLIPAGGFYEWTPEKKLFIFEGGAPSLIYLAGIYRQAGDIREFVILTREPVSLVAEIHNRMPVVIPKDQAEAWLYDPNAALELIRTAPPELVRHCVK